jgi:DNA integrity scanning protein DisA with diadenylate cyclase activity
MTYPISETLAILGIALSSLGLTKSLYSVFNQWQAEKALVTELKLVVEKKRAIEKLQRLQTALRKEDKIDKKLQSEFDVLLNSAIKQLHKETYRTLILAGTEQPSDQGQRMYELKLITKALLKST